MKLTAPRPALAAAAADAARAIPNRPPTPVLNALLVRADEDCRVTFTGYDFDTAITATALADVGEPGVVAIPGKALAAGLAGLPTGDVTITTDGARVAVASARTRFTLPTLQPEDYSALPALPPALAQLDAAALTAALASVAVTARPIEGMLWQQTVQVSPTATGVALRATDRSSAAEAHVDWPAGEGPAADMGPLVIPAKAFGDALRGATGTVTLHADGSGLLGVTTGHRVTVLRLLDVEFPMVDQIVVRGMGSRTHRMRVDADELADVCTRAARAVADVRGRLAITVDADLITYGTTGEADAVVSGELDHLGVDGNMPDLLVDPQLLADAARQFPGLIVDVGTAGLKKVIMLSSPDAPQLIQAVMPSAAVGGAR